MERNSAGMEDVCEMCFLYYETFIAQETWIAVC